MDNLERLLALLLAPFSIGIVRASRRVTRVGGKGFPLDLLPDLHDMQRVNIHVLWAFAQNPPTAIKCVERPE